MGDYHGFQLLLKNQGEVNHFKLLENNVLIQKFMDLFLKLCLSATVAITGRKNLQQQNLKNVEIKKNPQEKFDEYDDIDGEPI